MKLQQKNKDIKYPIGTRIGKVRVTAYDPKKCYYTFQCDCGIKFTGTVTTCNQKLKQVSELGNTGCKMCANKLRRSLISKEKYYRAVYHDYKRGALQRGYSFELSMEDCIPLFEGNCHYCGSAKSNSIKIGRLVITYNGIDRMENDQGYSLENVVSCCKKCNFAKNRYNYAEFIKHVEKIYKHLQRSGRHAVGSSDSKWRTPNLQIEEGEDMI